MGLFVKTKATGTPSWRTANSLFIKVSPTTWKSVSDAWVKVSHNTWRSFFSAPTEPTSPIEILTSYTTTTELLRLQGKNYRWVPAPATLQYKFKVINGSNPTQSYDITSFTTTSNPSSGSPIIVPSSTTYQTVTVSSGNYFSGAVNIFQFIVRATTASGPVVEKTAEYQMRIPAAPTLSFTELTSTSVRITITASSNDDYIATGRYILYTYDSTDNYIYSGGGRGGFAASSSTLTRDLTGLTTGRNYTVYVLPVTGYSGTTPTNYSGYPGVEASLSNVKAGSSDPQPFTTVSFTKAMPSSSSQGVVRSTTLNWNHSIGATRYEILYEAKTNPDDAWTTVQTFAASPYQAAVTNQNPIPTQTQTMQWGSPVPSGGFAYYNFMRAKIRASNPDSTVTQISDSDVYIEATGTNPGDPTFGSITFPTTTSASVPFTIGSTGSNYLDSSIEYMSRTDSGSYPASWSTQTYNSTSGQGTISLTTSGGTKYWVKMRIRNADNLYSNVVETNFTQPSVPTLQTGVRRSINTGTTFTNSSTTMYVSTNGYIAYGLNSPGSISIPTTGYVLNIFGPNDLSQTTTGGVTIQASYKNTTSYFVVSWSGRYLGSTTETLSYEARFYWNSDLVEVYCITNNLTALHYQSDNAVYNNGSATKTWKDNSTSISSWTSDTGMTNAGSPTSTDDGYTAITATKPVIKGTGTKRTIPLGITVTSGSTVAYVSTNGFIGLNSDPSTSIGVPSSGRYLNILQSDLKQTALFTKATSTTYAIRYQGHQLGDTAQTVDYEILFTFGSTSAQVFIIANNLTNAPSDNVLIVNGTASNTWSGANGSTMTATADTALTTNNNQDDARTVITLTAASSGSAPATPTNVNVSGSGSVSWTASTGATSYPLVYYCASNSTGANANGPYTAEPSSSPFQISYPTVNGVLLNYARAQVAAKNTSGTSAYSAWYPSSTTYV